MGYEHFEPCRYCGRDYGAHVGEHENDCEARPGSEDAPPRVLTTFDLDKEHYKRGYTDGWNDARAVPDLAPPCMRCARSDRMRGMGRAGTDFGGELAVWICRRCGIVAVLAEGDRPQEAS